MLYSKFWKILIQMKHFSVYLPDNNELERAVFVEDKFSILALFLTIFYTLYNRLYLVSFLILVIMLCLEIFFLVGYIPKSVFIVVTSFGLPLFCGFSFSSWLQSSLLRSKFRLASIVVANNLTEAKMKFFGEKGIPVEE